LPGSGIAQGSIFTILGTGMGAYQIAQSATLPLPVTLGGTSVNVKVGDESVDAPIMVASYGFINAILPSGTPTGSGTITVTYNGQPSQPQPIQIVSSAVGLYTSNDRGYGKAVATGLDYRLNTIIHAFGPGDYAILWGTGLGPIDGSDAALPPVVSVGGPVAVHVGTTDVIPYYAGRSTSFPGLDQIVFQIPAGVQGCYVPVAVENGGVVSNIATISVSTSASACADSILGQDLVSRLMAGNPVNFGYIRLERSFPFYGDYSGSGETDHFYGTFSRFTNSTAGQAVYGVSQGYCIAGSAVGVGLSDLSSPQLDAGASLTLVGQGTIGVPTVPSAFDSYGLYSASSNGWQFLSSGLNYTVSGLGGANIGAFSASGTTVSGGVTLSGVSAAQTVSRADDLIVQWTGEDPNLQDGQVTIVAYSTNSDYGAVAALQCTAPASAHSFTIPRWVLWTLPPSGSTQVSLPWGSIQIGQYNDSVVFGAQGLDRGIIRDVFFQGVSAAFK
jgi:uncharacterized protein (TIGR03437 family)